MLSTCNVRRGFALVGATRSLIGCGRGVALVCGPYNLQNMRPARTIVVRAHCHTEIIKILDPDRDEQAEGWGQDTTVAGEWIFYDPEEQDTVSTGDPMPILRRGYGKRFNLDWMRWRLLNISVDKVSA